MVYDALVALLSFVTGLHSYRPRGSCNIFDVTSNDHEEFQPFLGKKRKNLGTRSGQTNFDPVKGFQVWQLG